MNSTELADMTPEALAAEASKITVINDGQVRSPVYTSDMDKWIAENGKITATNYEYFCGAVDMACTGLMTGSREMIDLCEMLVNAGADYITLD